MHTKDKLAEALRGIGLDAMAKLATEGYYHDFLSPLAMPEMALIEDLLEASTPEALALRSRVIDGEFTASDAENDEWTKSEDGQKAFADLVGGR